VAPRKTIEVDYVIAKLGNATRYFQAQGDAKGAECVIGVASDILMRSDRYRGFRTWDTDMDIGDPGWKGINWNGWYGFPIPEVH
jgi:hypothetical protein